MMDCSKNSKSNYIEEKDIDRWETKQKLYDRKLAFFNGDITKLALDAIVNAANSHLAGGGGVDGAIHREVGHEKLQKECKKHGRCDPGKAVITKGFNRPAEHIIHAVGPMDCDRNKLEGCYETCFRLVKEHSIKSIAFPCIATGIYGYPNEEAAHIALSITKKHLKDNDQINLVVFCLFSKIDIDIYEKLKKIYFPGKDSHGRSIDELKKWSDVCQTYEPADAEKYPSNSKINEKILYDEEEMYNIMADAIINYGDFDEKLRQEERSSSKIISYKKVDRSELNVESLHIIRVKTTEENDIGKLYEHCLNFAVKKHLKSLIIPLFHSDEFDEEICKEILDAVRSWVDKNQNSDKLENIIFSFRKCQDPEKYLMPYFPPEVTKMTENQ